MTRGSSPFVSDIPAEQARRAWREACAAAGCPPRVDAVLLPVGEAVGRVTAESVWARRSSPAFDSAAMDGIAVRAAADSNERALLLGIPVRRLSLVTWVIAAGLSGIASLLAAPILLTDLGVLDGPVVLLAPLTAAVIARFLA